MTPKLQSARSLVWFVLIFSGGSGWAANPPPPSGWLDIITPIGDNSFTDSDIVTNSDRYPHVVYTDMVSSSSWSVKYQLWTGTAWTTTTVASGLASSPHVATALEIGTENPVVLFSKYNSTINKTDIKFSHWNGSTWSTQTVDTFTGESKGLDLEPGKDSSNGIGIVYHSSQNGGILIFLFWNGSSFSGQFIGPSKIGIPSLGYHSGSGNYHVVAIDADSNSIPRLFYARKSSGSWNIELHTTVLNSNDPGIYSPQTTWIALTTSGYPRISFFEKGSSSPKFDIYTETPIADHFQLKMLKSRPPP